MEETADHLLLAQAMRGGEGERVHSAQLAIRAFAQQALDGGGDVRPRRLPQQRHMGGGLFPESHPP
jgi:hypothetical protein